MSGLNIGAGLSRGSGLSKYPYSMLGNGGLSVSDDTAVVLGPYLPGTPYTVHSASRRMVTGFNGPAVRLYRVSDAIEQDFAFQSVTDLLDLAAIAAWAAGSQLKIKTVYNQMGGTLHLQQATVASMPRFYPNGDNGFSVLANDTPSAGSPNLGSSGMTVASVAIDRSQISVFHTERAYFTPNRIQFELATGAVRDLGIILNSAGAVSINAVTVPATALVKSQVQTNSIVGSLTQTDVRLGDQSYLGLAAQTSKVSTLLNLAKSVSDAGKITASDIYATVIYKEVRSDAATIHALLGTIFGEVAARAKRVVWDGDSLTCSYFGNFGRTRADVQDAFINPKNDLFNVSTYGFRYVSATPAVATRAGNLLRSTDVLVVTLGINDISANGDTGAQVYALLQTYLSTLRAVVSPKIVVCTIPPNAALQASGLTVNAMDFNTLLRTNAAILGVFVGDNYTDSAFNAACFASDLTYTKSPGDIHYTDAGYAKIAELERPGILAAIAA